MSELLARLRQAAEFRADPGQGHGAVGIWTRLRFHRELQEALRAKVGGRVARQLSAASRAFAFRRFDILRVRHIVPPYA
jgi:hypothetical protein